MFEYAWIGSKAKGQDKINTKIYILYPRNHYLLVDGLKDSSTSATICILLNDVD